MIRVSAAGLGRFTCRVNTLPRSAEVILTGVPGFIDAGSKPLRVVQAAGSLQAQVGFATCRVALIVVFAFGL